VPLYSGTPLLHGDTLFVPISSLEIGLAANPLYGCCTTSGAVAGLRAATGETIWYRRTIDSPAQVTGRHLLFVEEQGPSGAPVWGAPTVDAARGLVFFGTGQNYSHPTTGTSDAIFAVDMGSGEVRWVRQFTEQDAYNMSCDISRSHPNCPTPLGPDLDFGAPPVLLRSGGSELLIAGQKSGDVYALHPDSGEVAWTRRIGRGGALGGIHWGLAANEQLGLVLVPVSDVPAYAPDRDPEPGLHALDIATGAVRWAHGRKPRCDQWVCSAGLSAAITATPDLVFAGSLDGYLEAYDAASGDVLWSHDSWREYDTVNGVPASGGSFDAHGPMVLENLVIVSSGYDTFGQRPGNALLVFELQTEPSP
jgi:polyvinyl alcohol dehydrogenase (cytochrome)